MPLLLVLMPLLYILVAMPWWARRTCLFRVRTEFAEGAEGAEPDGRVGPVRDVGHQVDMLPSLCCCGFLLS